MTKKTNHRLVQSPCRTRDQQHLPDHPAWRMHGYCGPSDEQTGYRPYYSPYTKVIELSQIPALDREDTTTDAAVWQLCHESLHYTLDSTTAMQALFFGNICSTACFLDWVLRCSQAEPPPTDALERGLAELLAIELLLSAQEESARVCLETFAMLLNPPTGDLSSRIADVERNPIRARWETQEYHVELAFLDLQALLGRTKALQLTAELITQALNINRLPFDSPSLDREYPVTEEADPETLRTPDARFVYTFDHLTTAVRHATADEVAAYRIDSGAIARQLFSKHGLPVVTPPDATAMADLQTQLDANSPPQTISVLGAHADHALTVATQALGLDGPIAFVIHDPESTQPPEIRFHPRLSDEGKSMLALLHGIQQIKSEFIRQLVQPGESSLHCVSQTVPICADECPSCPLSPFIEGAHQLLTAVDAQCDRTRLIDRAINYKAERTAH